MARTKAVTYLHRNCIGSRVYVRGGEAEQAKPGANQAVLAAVIVHQPITVVAAVIFDCEALTGIKQVGTA